MPNERSGAGLSPAQLRIRPVANISPRSLAHWLVQSGFATLGADGLLRPTQLAREVAVSLDE